MDAEERDGRQRRSTPGLEATSQVVGAESEDDPGKDAPTTADHTAPDAPVDDPATRDVARADDEIGRSGRDRLHQRRQRRRIVRPVSVHLDDGHGATGQRHLETVQIGPAEALLHGTVADLDPWVARGEGIRDVTGPVGRAIVDHEDRGDRQLLEDGAHDRPEVVRLVVGRHDHPRAAALRARGVARTGLLAHGPSVAGRRARPVAVSPGSADHETDRAAVGMPLGVRRGDRDGGRPAAAGPDGEAHPVEPSADRGRGPDHHASAVRGE